MLFDRGEQVVYDEEFEQALGCYRQALRRAIHSKGYNNEPRTRYFLAMACWRLGKKDEANRWFDGTAPEPTSESLAAEPVSWFRQEAAAVLGRSAEGRQTEAGSQAKAGSISK